MTAIRFGPEVEFLSGVNLRSQMRQTAQKALKDVPRGDGSEISGVDGSSVDDRVGAGSIGFGDVLKRASDRIERANFLLFVAKSDADRLTKEQHVGDIGPGVWIEVGGQVLVDHARTKFYAC